MQSAHLFDLYFCTVVIVNIKPLETSKEISIGYLYFQIALKEFLIKIMNLLLKFILLGEIKILFQIISS